MSTPSWITRTRGRNTGGSTEAWNSVGATIGVGVGQRQRHDRVLGLARQDRLLGGLEELLVEIDVEAAAAVEELREHHLLGVGPELVEEDGLAPAGMADDHRRIEARGPSARGPCAARRRRGSGRPRRARRGEDARRGAAVERVAADRHARRCPARLAAPIAAQGTPRATSASARSAELGREVVVDEEDAARHGRLLPAPARALSRPMRPPEACEARRAKRMVRLEGLEPPRLPAGT